VTIDYKAPPQKGTVAMDRKAQLRKEKKQSQWTTSHYLRTYRKLWQLTASYYMQNFTRAGAARLSAIPCMLIREVRTYLRYFHKAYTLATVLYADLLYRISLKLDNNETGNIRTR
jgi:hypothetical protein